MARISSTPYPASCYQLVRTTERLELQNHCAPQMGAVYVDFLTGKHHHRRLFGGGKNQDIAKAVGLRNQKNPQVADLTAGFGGDAFTLACLGCHVSLLEHNTIAHALLSDGLLRAKQQTPADNPCMAVLERMTLYPKQDATAWLNQHSPDPQPDISYIDVMFPPRKKSALVQKEMQFLQAFESPDPRNEQLLLQAALQFSKERVVVKRPRKAPFLDNQPAHFSITGNTIRYDIYLCKTATKANQNKE